MEMVFLALWVNGGVAVMPEKYTAAQCKEIQDKNAKGYLLCIPAPKPAIQYNNVYKFDGCNTCIQDKNSNTISCTLKNCTIPDLGIQNEK